MATAAEQLLRNELRSDDNELLSKLLGETPLYKREIASEQTIGAYIRDNSAQTAETEIFPIKELIKIASTLKQAEADLKGKQDVFNASLQATYNDSVANSANSIYNRTNETLDRMEKYYMESIANIRRASRQELENVVSKLRDEYTAHYEEELRKRLKQSTKTVSYAAFGGDGQSENQLSALMHENEQLRNQLEFNNTPQVVVDTSAVDKANAQNKELKGEINKMQKEVETAQTKLTVLQQKKDKSDKYQKKLEATIKADQEQNKRLEDQIHDLETKLRNQMDAHTKEVTNLELKFDNRLTEAKNVCEKQVERGFETQIKELKEKALAQINQLEEERDRAEAKAAKLDAQVNQMLTSIQQTNVERKNVVKQANQATRTLKTSPDVQTGTSDSRGDSIQLEEELARARAELARSNRNWERRFAVLRASLHEIKDEAYIRKRIEVLPMSMHTAKVEYRSQSMNSNNPKFPIRDGRNNKRKQQRQLPSLAMQREIHAFSPVGSDTFLDEDESDDEGDNVDGANVRYIAAPNQSKPRIASAMN